MISITSFADKIIEVFINFNMIVNNLYPQKLNFEKKVIETEEANSSLSLEQAIVRWVGLEEIKQKFNASDIM